MSDLPELGSSKAAGTQELYEASWEWEVRQSRKHRGRPYFFNKKTGEVAWRRPSGRKEEKSSQVVQSDGRDSPEFLAYVSASTSTSTPLPKTAQRSHRKRALSNDDDCIIAFETATATFSPTSPRTPSPDFPEMLIQLQAYVGKSKQVKNVQKEVIIEDYAAWVLVDIDSEGLQPFAIRTELPFACDEHLFGKPCTKRLASSHLSVERQDVHCSTCDTSFLKLVATFSEKLKAFLTEEMLRVNSSWKLSCPLSFQQALRLMKKQWQPVFRSEVEENDLVMRHLEKILAFICQGSVKASSFTGKKSTVHVSSEDMANSAIEILRLLQNRTQCIGEYEFPALLEKFEQFIEVNRKCNVKELERAAVDSECKTETPEIQQQSDSLKNKFVMAERVGIEKDDAVIGGLTNTEGVNSTTKELLGTKVNVDTTTAAAHADEVAQVTTVQPVLVVSQTILQQQTADVARALHIFGTVCNLIDTQCDHLDADTLRKLQPLVISLRSGLDLLVTYWTASDGLFAHTLPNRIADCVNDVFAFFKSKDKLGMEQLTQLTACKEKLDELKPWLRFLELASFKLSVKLRE